MALLITVNGHTPQVDPTAWLAPTATLIGRVRIEANASVYYGAVLRGDINDIVLGAGSNLQDNVVVHTEADFPTKIGRYVGARRDHSQRDGRGWGVDRDGGHPA